MSGTSSYLQHMSSFTYDFALLYISWHDLFHVQAALTDVSLLNGCSHSSVVIGEKLLRYLLYPRMTAVLFLFWLAAYWLMP